MPTTSKPKPTADQIAEMASRGEDVSSYFTGKFTVVRPLRRVNVDLTAGMLRELDSSQAIIKTLLAQALRTEAGSGMGPKKSAL